MDDEDSAFSAMVDVQSSWSDWLATAVHATYYTQLDNEDPVDGSFWLVGGDITFAINDHCDLTAGYEKTFDFDHYRDHRINAGLNWYW